MPNWDKIQKEWETSDITFKELAEKHGVKDSTIRSRKNREKWQRNATDKNATQRKSVATKKKVVKQNKKTEKELVIENEDLTDKQRLFCLYYLKYFNATKAYQKAYDCAYTTAMVEGHRHLRKPKIASEIDRMREEKLTEKKVGADEVLQKYIDIAFSDITDFVEFGQKEITVLNELTGEEENVMINHVDFKNHSEVDGTILTEVKKGKDGVSIKLADKMKALEFLAKYTDLLSEFDRKRLQDEKVKAETEFTQLRSKQLKGTQKDTSMLDALVEGRKQYEQMMKDREKNE